MVDFQCSPFPGDLKGNWRGDWGWSGDVTLAGSSDKLAHQYIDLFSNPNFVTGLEESGEEEMLLWKVVL